MLYNQTKVTNGAVMPLLMGCTKPQPILAADAERRIYDPTTQSVMYDMRIVGTYSLKVHSTNLGSRGSVQDRKNEIDDQKNVK